MKIFSFISDRVLQFFSAKEHAQAEEADSDNFFGREKVLAFGLSLLFALCLWFIVNMSRDFTVTINVPIELVNLPEDQAVSSEVPESASISLSGEGWNLIPLYNNPPVLSLSAESRQINLFEQVRNRVGYFSNMNVLQVDPITLTIETENRASKKVPLRPRVDLTLQERFDIIGQPQLTPDSVTLTGAESKITDITEWETENVEFSDVHRSIEASLKVAAPSSGVLVEPEQIQYTLNVAEFTEVEMRVPVRTRNLPPGQAITYNPSTVTVKYDVPIDQYNDVKETRPFLVYVDYSTIVIDSTGIVTPEVEKASSAFDVRLRSFQPSRVSYFNILPE